MCVHVSHYTCPHPPFIINWQMCYIRLFGESLSNNYNFTKRLTKLSTKMIIWESM